MVNTTGDDLFPPVGALALFEAFPPGRKQLMLSEGGHGTEPRDMVEEIVQFLKAVYELRCRSAPCVALRAMDHVNG